MKTVTIYTDGSCHPNPGPGGFSSILFYGEHCKTVQGAGAETTNNQMEILSVVCGLESIKYQCQVSVYSDSQYVVKGMTEWLSGWKARSFRNVKNKELWQRLEAASQPHKINWNWVRCHAGDKWNEKADELANAARRLLVEGYLNEGQLIARTVRS